MNGLTVADFADTGQWRLIVRIYPTGISAHLENTLHTDMEPQMLFASTWEANSDTLLQNIENAVYDNPRVLDDFSARIIVFDCKTAFMPAELIEESEGAEEIFYTALYPVDPSDVITDADDDIVAVYSPAPGLKGFLSRTFPGARVESNLMEKVRRLRREGDGVHLLVETRSGDADFILCDGIKLLSASTRRWSTGADIIYHVCNLADIYGVSISDMDIALVGENMPEEVKKFLEERL